MYKVIPDVSNTLSKHVNVLFVRQMLICLLFSLNEQIGLTVNERDLARVFSTSACLGSYGRIV